MWSQSYYGPPCFLSQQNCGNCGNCEKRWPGRFEGFCGWLIGENKCKCKWVGRWLQFCLISCKEGNHRCQQQHDVWTRWKLSCVALFVASIISELLFCIISLISLHNYTTCFPSSMVSFWQPSHMCCPSTSYFYTTLLWQFPHYEVSSSSPSTWTLTFPFHDPPAAFHDPSAAFHTDCLALPKQRETI